MLALLITLSVVLCVALAVGLHVAVVLGFSAVLTGELFSSRSLLDAMGTIPWNQISNINLVALPLFILMGELLLGSGASEGMYNGLTKWLNRLPGGLLHTNILASAIFACISGSSAATAATVGGVAMPVLRRNGYGNAISLGSLAAGGTLGILIPPSIVMIVYGVLSETSIGQLYMSGIVPGVLLTVMFMVVIIVWSMFRPEIAPKALSSTWKEKIIALLSLLPLIVLMFLVLGTIYLGIATPTEAAALGVVGSLIIAAWNRKVNREMLRKTCLSTAGTVSMIVLILMGASILSFVASYLGIPAAITAWITEKGVTAMQFVLMVIVVFLLLASVMESLSLVVLVVPVIVPVLKTLHVDLVWFGIVLVLVVEVALITPPVGFNLFIMQGIANKVTVGDQGKHSDVFMGSLPFVFAIFLVLALLLLAPGTVWLLKV
ncbi:membrane protein [Betaproteobacteria bacterium]|nr:membrane protein [Betaproteobacteria bacterium]